MLLAYLIVYNDILFCSSIELLVITIRDARFREDRNPARLLHNTRLLARTSGRI